MSPALVTIALLAACDVASAATGATLVFNYPSGFAGQSGVATTGNAAQVGVALELTGPTYGTHQAGGSYYTTQQNIQSFTTDFTFQQDPSAYGFTFDVQNSNSTTNPGGDYGLHASSDANCLGYGAYAPPDNPTGTAIGNSVAIGFDLTGQEQAIAISPSLPNTATLLLNGGPLHPMVPQNDLNPLGINLHSGHVMSAHIVYDGSLLTMVLKDTSTGAQGRMSWPVNIPAATRSNSAWVGFTGGSIPNVTQNILSWDFYTGYNTRLATPTFSVAAGAYASTQTVSITGPAGATIYYTTNGLQPTTSSTQYTGPITVGTNEFVQAVAVQSGYTDSLVAAANYQIQATGAPVINLPSGFSSAAGLVTLAGAAQSSGSSIRLTDTTATGREASAAWYVAPVNVQNFTTTFTLMDTSIQSGTTSGSGITFAIQNQSPTSSDTTTNSEVSGGPTVIGTNGVSSSGLGYQGILNSAAVKFDLSTNTTGLYTNGATPNSTGQTKITGVSLSSGHPITVTLTYNGTALSLLMTDTTSKATFSTSWNINIPTTVSGNTAYVGFTGSTGYFYANQDIQSWTYTAGAGQTSTAPTVPAPPTNVSVQ
jgi:Chitobiase/beta-hexosaminidase C-terminal domain/Legume lectin domain